jgi:hypothetical protein
MAAGAGTLALIVAGGAAVWYFFKGKGGEGLSKEAIAQLSVLDIDRLEHKFQQKDPTIDTVGIGKDGEGKSYLVIKGTTFTSDMEIPLDYLKNEYVKGSFPSQGVPFEDWLVKLYPF